MQQPSMSSESRSILRKSSSRKEGRLRRSLSIAMRIACSVQCTSRTRTIDRKTIGARTARNAQVKIASCSTEQREIDESAKAGDPDLCADRNEGQQEGSDRSVSLTSSSVTDSCRMARRMSKRMLLMVGTYGEALPRK